MRIIENAGYSYSTSDKNGATLSPDYLTQYAENGLMTRKYETRTLLKKLHAALELVSFLPFLVSISVFLLHIYICIYILKISVFYRTVP